MVQVRADCEPSELLSFMAGASAAAASEAAQEAAINKAAEEELLDRVMHLILFGPLITAMLECTAKLDRA